VAREGRYKYQTTAMAMAINLMSRYFIVLLGVRHRHRAVSAYRNHDRRACPFRRRRDAFLSLSLSLARSFSFSLCVAQRSFTTCREQREFLESARVPRPVLIDRDSREQSELLCL